MRILSRSGGLKLAALVIAVSGFVLLYETRILDSRDVAGDAIDGAAPEPGAKLQFTATAYCKGTTTASGVAVRSGIAAADPLLLPVGSVVNITSDDPIYNGVYTILDTGPKVQGRMLDLYIWSCYEALDFGRRSVQIEVLRLGWDPAASSPSLVERLFRAREARRTTIRQAPAAAASSAAEDAPASPPSELSVDDAAASHLDEDAESVLDAGLGPDDTDAASKAPATPADAINRP